MVTFGSLFAGIGGFDLGFERAGMVCKWQVEIDDYATRVLEKHWPNVRRHRDIRTFPPRSFAATYSWRGMATGPFAPDRLTETTLDEWGVDVICGGFPCQDISYAGLGAGLDGERSGLFFEAIRVVRQLKPKVLVLENVAALLTLGLDRVLGTLAEIGFDAEWHCIPAAYFGTHFRRDRVFIIASSSITSGVRRQRLRAVKTRAWSKQQFARLVERELQICVPAGQMQRVSDGIPNRVDRLRGLGNAVVPQVAEYIGRQVVKSLTETR